MQIICNLSNVTQRPQSSHLQPFYELKTFIYMKINLFLIFVMMINYCFFSFKACSSVLLLLSCVNVCCHLTQCQSTHVLLINSKTQTKVLFFLLVTSYKSFIRLRLLCQHRSAELLSYYMAFITHTFFSVCV